MIETPGGDTRPDGKRPLRSLAHLLPLLWLLLVSWSCDARGGDAGGASEGLDRVSLRLPIPVVDAAFAPYYLAQDRGIFRRHGLEVRLEPGSPELNPVRMVDAGSDQFGVVGGPELLMAGQAAGAQLRGIGLLHRDANFPVIITLERSGIDTVPELAGRRIGFFIGHISTDVLRAFLNQEGIEYEQVDVGFNYSPLLAGQVDASWAFRTTAGITLPEQGVGLNVIDPAAHGIRSQGHMIITHERLIEGNPDLVRRFVAAVMEGVQLSLERPQEAVDATVARDSNFSPAVGARQIEIYNRTIEANPRLGWIETSIMEEVADRQKRLGVLPESYRITGRFTNEFLPDSVAHSPAVTDSAGGPGAGG